jgi:hypothetical protein
VTAVVIPDQRGGDSGPSYVKGTWEHPMVTKDKRDRLLAREDEEILAIIIAATEYLQ